MKPEPVTDGDELDNILEDWFMKPNEKLKALLQAYIQNRERLARIDERKQIYDFTTHNFTNRLQYLPEGYISITDNVISFGRHKPPYKRVVISYDTERQAIRFHQPKEGEYDISYKIGQNPASKSYGFRARPFMSLGVLQPGYYKEIDKNTYLLAELRVQSLNQKDEL